jgi:hypothetical protein
MWMRQFNLIAYDLKILNTEITNFKNKKFVLFRKIKTNLSYILK